MIEVVARKWVATRYDWHGWVTYLLVAEYVIHDWEMSAVPVAVRQVRRKALVKEIRPGSRSTTPG